MENTGTSFGGNSILARSDIRGHNLDYRWPNQRSAIGASDFFGEAFAHKGHERAGILFSLLFQIGHPARRIQCAKNHRPNV